jgi:hypothetical protein
MATSQNGWSANDRSMIASYSLPGGRVALRKGDASVVLLWVANRFHETVEPLRWPGNWGYAERPIRGSSTTLSNHASGTALDLNAPAHPLGKRGTFSAAQVRAIRSILGFCEGTVRWGGDYRSRADEMHLELVANARGLARVADKIRGASLAPAGPPPPPRVREDEFMYIKCQPAPDKPVMIAMWNGPIFVGLSTPGEIGSAEGEIKRGAICQWVELGTWLDLDRRSHALCDNPRPVYNVMPSTPAPAPTPATGGTAAR